jgi:Zn-dependent protease
MIHEVAHGSVAYQLGDPTAKYAGRLSLNPIKHIDPFGTVLLPLMLLFLTAGNGPVFGWAKPVPVNPFNFKDQKWGDLKVSIAGPLANFSLALVFGLFIRFFTLSPSFEIIFSLVVI